MGLVNTGSKFFYYHLPDSDAAPDSDTAPDSDAAPDSDTAPNNDAPYDIEGNDGFIIKDGVLEDYWGPGGDIVIPNSVTPLGFQCLHWRVTSITIPDSVTSIGRWAFYMSKLTNVPIPNSVTSIGEAAFQMSKLTDITIPSSVTEIGVGAFADCESLTSITVDDGNDMFVSENGILFSKNKSKLYAYPSGKTETSYTIPDSVTKIEGLALSGCINLTSVTIPDSVTEIGMQAFLRCSNLNSVTIPDSVIEIGENAFRYCRNLNSVTIPDSVTEIGEGAFSDCDNPTIHGTKGSYAETYAVQNEIPFIAD